MGEDPPDACLPQPRTPPSASRAAAAAAADAASPARRPRSGGDGGDGAPWHEVSPQNVTPQKTRRQHSAILPFRKLGAGIWAPVPRVPDEHGSCTHSSGSASDQQVPPAKKARGEAEFAAASVASASSIVALDAVPSFASEVVAAGCERQAPTSPPQGPADESAAQLGASKRRMLVKTLSEAPMPEDMKASAAPELLVNLVLRKAGPARLERAVELLRERVANGRKIHGRNFSVMDVDAALLLFSQQPSVAAETAFVVAETVAGAAVGAAVLATCASSSFSSSSSSSTPPTETQQQQQQRPHEGRVGEEYKPREEREEERELEALCEGSYLPPSSLRRLLGDQECAICFEPLLAQALTIGLCGHIFHRGCLNRAGGVACPSCRRPVDIDRDRLAELRALVVSAPRAEALRGGAADGPSFLRCNILELSHGELLRRCSDRRRQGQPAFEASELGRVLEELRRERQDSILIEEDSVTLML